MIRCIPTSDHPAVTYACEELARHWALLDGAWPGPEPVLRVGPGLAPSGFSQVDNPELDDAILIDVQGAEGVVTGSNPRSVLIAAYRFLHELGFWFVKPGPQGTLVRYNGKTGVRVCEAASYRHRGFCIEGAVSYENVLELIDWLPKNGFNTYFTQFLVPYEFFKTWYAHDNNPLLRGSQPVPPADEVERFTYGEMSDALKRRGMLFHATGHGWTTNAVGITGLGWDESQEPEERYTHWLAQIDGKRALFHSRPLNTNLCYSNPKVREALTDEILHFLRRHPQVDVVHFWLADDSNNSCECEACRKDVPAAFYLETLNLLDEKLTREGLSTKIVFLAYLDLLWPPKAAVLRNPDRFLFMFAPITRSYSAPLPVEAAASPLPPFERNRLVMPENVAENIAFLRAWQGLVQCDSFIYEYHYMWDQFKDISDYRNARILWQDVRNLKQLGLNGYISCQQTRVFLPCGFGMHVLGRTLWNRDTGFDEMADAYFGALFGAHAERVRGMLDGAAELLRPACLRGEESILGGESAEGYRRLRLQCLLDSRWCMDIAAARQGAQARLWQGLCYWCGLCAGYAHYLEACALADEEGKAHRLAEFKQFLRLNEPAYQEDLDVYWFIKTLDRMIVPAL